MGDDDDIIDSYDRELGPEPGLGPRRAGRGFWIVVVTIVAAGAILMVEIFANRDVANTIGRAQHDLRVAERAARSIVSRAGSFEPAVAPTLDAAGLDDGALSVVGPDERSSGLGEVSVYADDTTWAAAVSVRPNGCFYLKLVLERDDALYGSGTVCTGRAALDARDPRW